jgi:hypothetical protein
MFEHALREGFLRPQHRALVLTAHHPDALLAAMQAWRPPPLEKWLTPETA